MVISDRAWDSYISLLRNINNKAAQEMFSYLANNEWYLNNTTKQAAIDYAFGLATKYGEAASEAVCQFYDQIVNEWSDNILPAAMPAKTATYSEVATAFNGTAKQFNDELIADAVGRLAKLAGVDTVMQNAIRDGAEWAWIPRGDTCAFCLALAARGWQPASKKAIKNGHAEHVHANCDCTYAVRFRSDQDVEGYDNGTAFRKLYNNADGDTPKQKINAMRRSFYEQNKEKINEQKRSAYEKRQERNSSAAEELDVT